MYHPQDFFFHKAKKEGYLARSVYKLMEMDQKFKLIQNGSQVIDLGCAPGSWLKYLSEKVGPKGHVLAVDKTEIAIKEKNIFFIQSDILESNFAEISETIKKMGWQEKFDGVFSDLAPNTSGVKDIDSARSYELCSQAWEWTKFFLKPRGIFLMKIFEGSDSEKLFSEIKKQFYISRKFRPKATRPQSREVYHIFLEYKPH